MGEMSSISWIKGPPTKEGSYWLIRRAAAGVLMQPEAAEVWLPYKKKSKELQVQLMGWDIEDSVTISRAVIEWHLPLLSPEPPEDPL